MRLKYGIAIAGMHGKTTTTSMVASCSPPVARPHRSRRRPRGRAGSNARLGTTQYLVAEADESDRSFLKLSPILPWSPTSTASTWTATATWPTSSAPSSTLWTACRFTEPSPPASTTAAQSHPARVRRRVFTYGVDPEADFQLEFVASANASPNSPVDIRFADSLSTPLSERLALRTPCSRTPQRSHATAAVAIARQLEVPAEKIAEAWSLPRRGPAFSASRHGTRVTVVDDYGHHPTEIRATCRRPRVCHRKIHVSSSPRYNRTLDLLTSSAAHC